MKPQSIVIDKNRGGHVWWYLEQNDGDYCVRYTKACNEHVVVVETCFRFSRWAAEREFVRCPRCFVILLQQELSTSTAAAMHGGWRRPTR